MAVMPGQRNGVALEPRVRAVETAQAAMQVRVDQSAFHYGELKGELAAIRREQKESSDIVYGAINALRTEVHQSVGWRKALVWGIGTAIALIGVLIALASLVSVFGGVGS